MNQPQQQKVKPKDWVPQVKPFAQPATWRSLMQVATSYLPFLALWYAAYRALEVHWGLTLVLDLAAALFLVRIFILQHDAGHGSFFKSSRANDALGFVSGVLTLTPYGHWRHSHARHHATSGNLDKRGVGDIYTMTTEEYLAATPWQRFSYRVYRNPFVMFLIGPVWVFMLSYRLPLGYGSDKPKVRASVWWTNLALAGLIFAIFYFFGWKAFLLVYLPVQYFAAMLGIFLFYVQHQFEDAYWEPDPRWEYLKAAMEGSTYLKLPRLLQWLTGNIGLHHVHHLAPKIPNYRLQEAHDQIELMKVAPTVTLADAFRIAFADLHLFDPKRDRLVGFRDVAAQVRAADAERQSGERTVQ
ncbi:MAG TPA: fatty acid desaturase [Oceanithermus profundus]|uniref:Fatty acid desaturase n=1 Tax=Oceanithermus profundus TaxID=187137 RepID=A0A7C4VE54_9DEIN|nr:fatty acid desaturase [Oceanithermus profundus]